MERDEKQSAQSRIADHASCKLQEGQVDIRPTFVAHGEPLEVPGSGEGPLHNPAVLPQLLRRFDATPRNPRQDAPDLAGNPASPKVVGFVRMQLPESVPWPPPAMAHSRNRIDQFLEGNGVMLVRRPDQHVIPLPHPISLGKSAQRMPVFRTKRIPRKAF